MENKVFRSPARWIFYILRVIYEKGLLKTTLLLDHITKIFKTQWVWEK